MDRVAFLIESTGERLDCLLNPETLEITRQSGVRQKRSVGGVVTGSGLADDPLLYTGGGTTEVKLDLLFDVSLEDASATRGGQRQDDVRQLTQRIWQLAENVTSESRGQLTVVRLVWGKAWNIPGVVVSAAERFECFTPEGVPQRSWLRLRFRRVPEPPGTPAQEQVPAPAPESLQNPEWLEGAGDFPTVETVGGGEGEEGARPLSEPLYLLASRQALPASSWRSIAYLSGIDDPFHIPAGTELRLPSV
jgi:hypothetical protein